MQFTKEQLIAKAREQIAFFRHTRITGEGRTHVNQCSALFEIALASLDAEPVAWDYEWASCVTCEGPQNFKRIIEREAPPEWGIDEGRARNIIPLYATPPAPVVPEEKRDDDGNTTSEFDHGWNSCRAAMLQGSQPVSHRDELPEIECDICGFKSTDPDGAHYCCEDNSND